MRETASGVLRRGQLWGLRIRCIGDALQMLRRQTSGRHFSSTLISPRVHRCCGRLDSSIALLCWLTPSVEVWLAILMGGSAVKFTYTDQAI